MRLIAPAAVAAASALTLTPAHAGSTVDYRYDDGVSNITLGPPRSFAEFGDIDMLWGNYFFTDNPREAVTEIAFGLGSLSADPTNATPIFNLSVTGENLGFGFNSVAVTPTLVSGGFFVAIGHLAERTGGLANPDYPSPARYDPDGRADRSWFFYDSDIPEQDLASSGFVQRMDGPFVPIPGAFAIRATTTVIPAPAPLAALALVGSMTMRRRRR